LVESDKILQIENSIIDEYSSKIDTLYKFPFDEIFFGLSELSQVSKKLLFKGIPNFL
jgi:hypothetical protein